MRSPEDASAIKAVMMQKQQWGWAMDDHGSHVATGSSGDEESFGEDAVLIFPQISLRNYLSILDRHIDRWYIRRLIHW